MEESQNLSQSNKSSMNSTQSFEFSDVKSNRQTSLECVNLLNAETAYVASSPPSPIPTDILRYHPSYDNIPVNEGSSLDISSISLESNYLLCDKNTIKYSDFLQPMVINTLKYKKESEVEEEFSQWKRAYQNSDSQNIQGNFCLGESKNGLPANSTYNGTVVTEISADNKPLNSIALYVEHIDIPKLKNKKQKAHEEAEKPESSLRRSLLLSMKKQQIDNTEDQTMRYVKHSASRAITPPLTEDSKTSAKEVVASPQFKTEILKKKGIPSHSAYYINYDKPKYKCSISNIKKSEAMNLSKSKYKRQRCDIRVRRLSDLVQNKANNKQNKSKKFEKFVSEPMTKKCTIDVPGIGYATALALYEREIYCAKQLLSRYVRMKKNKRKFIDWLLDVADMTMNRASECIDALDEYLERENVMEF